MSGPVLVSRQGVVATLTLNRPDALNTLDFAMMDSLVAAVADVAADDALRAVILRGAGKHFMAGGDLRTFAGELTKARAARQAGFTQMIGRLHSAIELLQRMPHPVVARVHGAVAGFGLSLVAACDLAIAADSAYFASAYRQIALTPDGGMSWTLPRIVGLRKATEILLLGERFDAQQAMQLGLVNRVVPVLALDATVEGVVQALVTGPTLALRNAKRLLYQSSAHSLSEQLDAESRSFGECAGTADFEEGIAAFLEKRPPQFGRGSTP
ncbi:MAG: enoyl-CoA hydratase/isomerase family protein [Betaproteobacteria bacterium]|nr:enoyl-CoA hydratase/isomerase family protein [Betaproteobacteria bacterium]MBA3776565.1 enoyl-CoA hydratase/isomerase family protein [Betaproteobacteria bacterium]